MPTSVRATPDHMRPVAKASWRSIPCVDGPGFRSPGLTTRIWSCSAMPASLRSAVTGEERDDLTDGPPTCGADLQRHAPGLEDEEATDEGGVVVGAGGEGHPMGGPGPGPGPAGLPGGHQPR